MSTTMKRFRDDNTSGYSAAELAELNRRFDALAAGALIDKSNLDRIAEQVLALFDAERVVLQ